MTHMSVNLLHCTIMNYTKGMTVACPTLPKIDNADLLGQRPVAQMASHTHNSGCSLLARRRGCAEARPQTYTNTHTVHLASFSFIFRIRMEWE